MTTDALFTPVSLGTLDLPNRVIMAPLTRARATRAHVPTPVMADYYAQRAACGLIISEATAVDPLGMGWYRAPGIWNAEMVAGWRQVTQAVHVAGGRIYAQLWHMGRLVLPDYIGGALPMGPSAIAGEGETFAPVPEGDPEGPFLPMKPYVVPREMTSDDIRDVIAAYGRAAQNAMDAGFDGIEIHAANGYIIDQFLQSKTNRRTDDYGGSIDNRCRLLRDILAVVVKAVPADRTGIRISPTSARKGMGDEDPHALAAAIGQAAQAAGVAYVHLIEPIASGFMEKADDPVMASLRAQYQGAVIQNGGFEAASARDFILSGHADAISFGRPFIANPDLVRRMRDNLPLAEADMTLAYVGDARGYSDYPALS